MSVIKKYIDKGYTLPDAKNALENQESFLASVEGYFKMVKIPGKTIEMLNTEVTNRLYQCVTNGVDWGRRADDSPVTSLMLGDACRFCNKLSNIFGYEPVYDIKYNQSFEFYSRITENKLANGFRLPTQEEVLYATKNEKYQILYESEYSSESFAFINLVQDRRCNRQDIEIFPVFSEKVDKNDYCLYGLTDNVFEWILDPDFNSEYFHYLYAFGSTYESDGKKKFSCWDKIYKKSGQGIRFSYCSQCK